MVLDSQRWKCVEAVPPILFSVEGLSAVRGREPRPRGLADRRRGRVDDVRDHHVVLEDDVTLAYVAAAADRSPAAARVVREADAERRAGGRRDRARRR